MGKIHPKDMTPGQLKLHYAAVCKWHQSDAIAALARASTAPVAKLRTALVAYEDAKAKEDWTAAETALLSILPEDRRHA